MSPDSEGRECRLRQWSWKAIAARSLDNGDLGGRAGGEVDHSRAGGLDIRYRLDVAAHSVIEVDDDAGGWLFDRVMAGWDATVFLAADADVRELIARSCCERTGQRMLNDIIEQRLGQFGHCRSASKPRRTARCPVLPFQHLG